MWETTFKVAGVMRRESAYSIRARGIKAPHKKAGYITASVSLS
jgi:hypothetical protein